MREAPALAGVTGKAPRSNPSRPAKAPGPRQAAQGSLVGRAFARPGVTIAGAAFAALMTGIVANALFLQKGHHASPLFGASHGLSVEPAKAPAAVDLPSTASAPSVVTPPPAAQDPAPAASAPAPVQPAASVQAGVPTAVKAKPKAAKQAHVDGIGQLLGNLSGRSPAAASQKPAHRPAEPAKTTPKPHHPVAQASSAPHN